MILILAGAVVIVAVYLYSRYRKDPSREFRKPGYQESQSSFNSTPANSTIATTETMEENGRSVIVDPSIYSCEPESTEAENFLYEEHDEFDDELSELGRTIKIEKSKIEENTSVQDTSMQAEDDVDLSLSVRSLKIVIKTVS